MMRKQHAQEVELLENENEVLRASAEAQASQLETMARAERARAEQVVAESKEEIDKIEAEAIAELEHAEEMKREELRKAEAKRSAQLEHLEQLRLEEIAEVERNRELDRQEKEAEIQRLEQNKQEQLQLLNEQRDAELKSAEEKHRKEKRNLKAQQMQKDVVNDAKQKELLAQRRAKYDPLVLERDEIADTVREYMKMLGIEKHESKWKEFEKKHYSTITKPEVCKDEDVVKLEAALRKVRKVRDRLKDRVESDAILLALKEIAKRGALKSINLLMQITSGQKALKEEKLDPKDVASVAQIQHYLTRQGIPYTDEAWTYFLQSAESSTTSKKPLKLKKIAAVLDGTFMKVETS